jgi:hypothetical protein
VLRLFPDEVGVFLAPGKVVLARSRSGGWKSRAVAEKVLTVEPESEGDWTAALAALEAELGDEAWRRTRVRVIVANEWVRYELLPWSVELGKESERLAHARYLLTATYGDVVEQWTVALSSAAPGVSRLVSAMPTALIDAVKHAMIAPALELVSVQPQLVAAYNVWRHRLPRAAAWFATIDESSLVAMHVRDGHCDRVRSVRISDDWAVELRRIQTMGRLAQSRPAEGPQRLRAVAGDQADGVEWLEAESQPSSMFARLAALQEALA